MIKQPVAVALLAVLLSACTLAVVPSVAPFAWPASLVVVGDGYPNPGDPCRTVGESAATAEYLDDAARLVGCPGRPDSDASKAVIAQRGARRVGEVDGVTLLSVPER